MRTNKPFLTQQELDTRLFNLYLLLMKKNKTAPVMKVSLLGNSNMVVAVSSKKCFPIYFSLGGKWFKLGLYSSEELETNPQVQLEYPKTTYLNYQDIRTIYEEIQKLKLEYLNVSTVLVGQYYDQLPRDFILTLDYIKEIFSSCTTRV